MNLTEKDVEKLKAITGFVEKGTACTMDKKTTLNHLKSILEPRCAVCRKPIEKEMIVINQRKLHLACKKRYKH